MSAASRTRVGTRPPSPGLGPVPCSRGPFPAQGPAAAAGRAPRGGWAGVFNGSMLPAAGAAPGQAGPPARPQSPRSHQLQLQLRALRLPQSPAALTGKSVNRRSRRGLTLGSFSLCFPLPPAFTSATPSFLAVHPDPALPIVWGFVGWPFDLRGFSYILGATYFLVPGLHAGGVREPSRPFPVTPRPPRRPVLSGLTLSNDFVSLLFSAFQSGSWASLS